MNTDHLKRRKWHGGKLLAYSGIDGRTDCENGLTARTSFERTGIDIKLPGECSLTFPGIIAGDIMVSGDWFEFSTERGGIKGTFLDAYHLLVQGACDVLCPSWIHNTIRLLQNS